MRKMAELLVDYSLDLREGDLFLIQAGVLAQPLVEEVFRRSLEVGAHPEVHVQLPGLTEVFFDVASPRQLQHVSPIRRLVTERYDAHLSILAPYNLKALTGVAPAKQAEVARAGAPLARLFRQRAMEGSLRWSLTLYPTEASAQEAGMALHEYEAFVFQACRLHTADPRQAWQEVGQWQAELVRRLSGLSELRVVGEGTDLRFRVGGRRWLNADGHLNLPDGEVFTAPVENSVEGRIRFSFPAIFAGREVAGVELEFAEGRVIAARAERGEELLHALLETDPGARYVGEVGIGTNWEIDRFTRNMLFDEKIGGTIHLALGASYPESGGQNESGIHWDMLCDLRRGGEIYGDGELIYRDGKFL